MAVFAIVFWTFPTVQPGSHSFLNSELLKTYNWVGSYDQRMAHLLASVTIVILATIAFLSSRQGQLHIKPSQVLPPLRLWTCVVATVVIMLLYGHIVPQNIMRGALILIAAFFSFVVFAPYLTRASLRNVSLFVIGGYLSFVAIPGFLATPIPFIAPNGDVLAQAELHISSLLLPGVGLSAGQSFFKDLPYNYGLLMPSIMSVIDHRYGPMSISDQLRFVQYCQVLFVLIASAAYFLYRPRNYFGVLVVLALAAPFWSSAHVAIWHPNQSGFRSLTLPLGALGLILVAKFRPKGADWLLGALGGVMVLINQETAVAMGASFLVYTGLRTRKFPIASGLRMASAAVLTIIAYFVVYRIALGRLPFSTNVHGIFQTLLAHTTGSFGDRLFAAGSQHENYYIVPFALTVFAHATYVLIDAFRRAGKAALAPRSALRAAISATIIIWLSYYFNFPNWWQIWTHLFLYGFLIIDMFDPRLFALGSARRGLSGVSFFRSMRIRWAHAVPILLLALMIPRTNSQLMQYTRELLAPYWVNEPHNAAPISGILMTSDMAGELKTKSESLIAISKANNGSVLYLTYNVAFIPTVSRIFLPVPERNLFSNIAGDDDFARVMDGVLAQRKQVILIDRADGPLAVSMSRKELQDKIRRAVARDYRLDRTEGGWEVWVRQSQS